MIRFNKPTLKRRDMDSVLQTMVNEQIGPGDISLAFNTEFAQKTGCITSVSYRTYYDCIEAALKLAGAEPGFGIAVSPLAPLIYKEVIEKIGCKAVLVDVERENGLPSEKAVIESGCTVFVLYENCGTLPLKYNNETTFADKLDYSSVTVIEDVTQSLGGRLKDEAKPGDWGQIVVSAFEDDDVVSCAGGATLAVKPSLAGFLRYRKPHSYNALTDLNASLGLVQMSNLEENCMKRREILRAYQQSLAKTKHTQFGLKLLDFDSNAGCFPVFLDKKPDEIFKFAEKHEVPVVKTFEKSIMSNYEGDAFEAFPVAAAYFYRTVSFPIYPFLKTQEIDDISKVIAHLP